MSQVKWIEELTDLDRKSFVFLLAYQRVRRKYQTGYLAAIDFDPSILEQCSFKQSRAVVAWLSKEGWHITWKEYHWQGYIKHCFKAMANIPMVGQLRNKKHLRDYLKTIGDRDTPVHQRSRGELYGIYNRVLREPFAGSGQAQAALGLRPAPRGIGPEDAA